MDYTFIGFIGYLILIVIIGIITYRANKSHEDFFLGGRQLNPWLVAFSERTAAESAWLLLGLPGAAMATGLIEVWTALGCVLGIICYWFTIAQDLRVESEKVDSITLPNFFAQKFNKEDKVVRTVSSIIIVFFFTFYLAAQFNGAGKALNVTFDIPLSWGIAIGAFIIIIYTMMGGFLAVVWTDLIQGIIMIGALVVLPIVGLFVLDAEGLSISKALTDAGDKFSSLTKGEVGWTGAALVIGGLSWGFGYFGQPHLVTKFMAIKNPKQIKVGRRIAIMWAAPAFFGSVLIGLVGLAMYGSGFFDDPEKIMPHMANTLLPPWLAGIFISGAIAAIMSTADSQLLVISSSVIEDFYHRTLGKKVSGRKLLFLSRILTLLVGVAAFLIAITSKELIFELVSYAWAGLGASFGPALILTLKWKKTTKRGVLAGMITGAAVTALWKNIPFLHNLITERFSAFVLAFAAVVIVSLATNNKESS